MQVEGDKYARGVNAGTCRSSMFVRPRARDESLFGSARVAFFLLGMSNPTPSLCKSDGRKCFLDPMVRIERCERNRPWDGRVGWVGLSRYNDGAHRLVGLGPLFAWLDLALFRRFSSRISLSTKSFGSPLPVCLAPATR